MTAAYVPEVGDRVRLASWAETDWMVVLHVGGKSIFGIDNDGDEWCPNLDREWIKVETPTPLPERWINAYPDGFATTYLTRAIADEYAGESRIALVRIWTDADGVDRIERVTA